MKQALKEALLNVLFPWDVTCPLCQRTLEGWERLLCMYCEAELFESRLTLPERVSSHEPLRMCISAFAYEHAARQLIHHLKYNSNTTLAPVLGLHMCAALLDVPIQRDWDVVIPVPMHPSRLRERGYNQAQLLAKEVAKCFGWPLRTDLLLRIKAGKSQTTRSAEERRVAMQDAFEAVPQVAGLRILLVDDVLTTGATATACAQALLDAGAAQVTLLTACQA